MQLGLEEISICQNKSTLFIDLIGLFDLLFLFLVLVFKRIFQFQVIVNKFRYLLEEKVTYQDL